MISSMIERVLFKVGKDLVADGTSEVLTAVVDMANADEVTFIVDAGDVDAAAVMTYTVKENTANSTSSPTPTTVTLTQVGGTGATISSGSLTITESSGNLDDKLTVISVPKSKLSKRYVFLSITCTVESHEVDSIITLVSRNDSVPVTQTSDVAAYAYA